MRLVCGTVALRNPEPRDVAQLYKYRNDKEVTELLGGFSSGYSLADLHEWMEFHRKRVDEIIWIIADLASDICLGHVGYYNIDSRVRKAEFAIMIGDKASWNHGIGKSTSKEVLNYGFEQLNFHRIELEVLASNLRAIRLYQGLGFQQEGILRDAQFRDGRYVDVVRMGLLAHERNWG